MNYIVSMGSDAIIYIRSFIKIGSGIKKFSGGDIHTNTHTHRQQGYLISLLLSFQNKECRLKMVTEPI
jgi:hypothetical protein